HSSQILFVHLVLHDVVEPAQSFRGKAQRLGLRLRWLSPGEHRGKDEDREERESVMVTSSVTHCGLLSSNDTTTGFAPYPAPHRASNADPITASVRSDSHPCVSVSICGPIHECPK